MALNEKKWWSTYVKPAWTSLARGRVANKVQDAFNGGLPDTDVCFNGVTAKIELKYTPNWPKYETDPLTFSMNKKVDPPKRCIASPSQMVQLRVWRRCKGLAFLLIGVQKEWFLLDIDNISDELNDRGITQAELFALAVVTGASYQDLYKVPEYLERTYHLERTDG